jgi:sporulation protein YlmC with PRC-barrel domain
MHTQAVSLQLQKNAQVSLADGTVVGRVDRVVLDPRTREVSHIVVRKGWLFASDRVVPVDWIGSASEAGVTLHAQPDDVDALPEFEAEEYVRVSDDEQPRAGAAADVATPLFWYPLGSGALPYGSPPAATYTTRTTQNIPEGNVALKPGAKVMTRDDQHVGNVDEVLTDARTERALGLVISQGLFLKEKRRVPITWVDHIEEDTVRLLVGARQLETLGFKPD